MNYEQKYKEALDWMRELYPSFEDWVKEDAEHYFPELKESEDERIRKMLCAYIHDFGVPKEYFEDIEISDVLAWLEKQSKKLDADEVIEWIKTHGNFWPVVTIEINKVIAKFKKDFEL